MKKIFLFLPFLICLLFGLHAGAQNKDTKFKIVIDAGHGGKDGGCMGKILKEKDLNLDIALKVGKLIEQNHPDVQVVYTRKTDVFIALNARTEIANQHKADLFMSIHADAIPKSKNTAAAYGAGTFTLGTAKTEENLEVAKRENAVIVMEDDYKASYQGFDPNIAESYIMFETLQGAHQSQSILFASMIQDEFKNRAQRHDRQVRQAPYLVLKTASMPAVLIEVGFLSNAQEEKFLSTNEGKNKIVNSIYHGFKNYKNNFDRHDQSSSNAGARPTTTKAVVTAQSAQVEATPKRIEKSQESAKATTHKATSTPSKPTATASKNQSSNGKLTYKIQFLSYHKNLAKGAPQLKGLWPVEYSVNNGTYRFTYGEYSSFKEAQNKQAEIKGKFKDAFIIRYKDGKRVSN